MATYVVSDIHGYKSRFDRLLSTVGFDWANDELYILGDILDRGPESAEMLVWAVNAPENVHFLMGNHEDMALAVLKYDLNAYFNDFEREWEWPSLSFDVRHQPWAWNGGPDTMDQLCQITDAEWRRYKLIPWLENLPLYYIVNNWLFVHAGLGFGRIHLSDDIYSDGRNEWVKIPGLAEEEFSQHLLWIRETWLLNEVDQVPYNVIFGHTPTTVNWAENIRAFSKNLIVRGNAGQVVTLYGYGNDTQRMCIDTGRSHLAIIKLDDLSVTYGV